MVCGCAALRSPWGMFAYFAANGVADMVEIWGLVFGVCALLFVAVLSAPVAKRVRMPHSVFLALIGALGGYSLQAMGFDNDLTHTHQTPIRDALMAISDIRLSADMILFVFLPALVFESAMNIELRRLRRDLPIITFLAVIGVVISTFYRRGQPRQFRGHDVDGRAIGWRHCFCDRPGRSDCAI